MQISIFGYKLDLEILILIGIIYMILVGHTVCGCCNMGGMRIRRNVENFAGASTNNGMSMEFKDYNVPVDYQSWGQPSLVVKPGEKPNAAVQAILDRDNGPLPLAPNEMLLFANTEFKPECCGNSSTYSTSTGCACMSPKMYNYLVQRGQNNIPYSVY